MALDPIKIDIEVNKANFDKNIKSLEKDVVNAKIKIDENLRAKFEFDVANAQLKLKELRTQLRNKDLSTDKKIQLQIETNRASRNLSELQRQLKNIETTGDPNVSRLQQKFDSLKWWILNATNAVKIFVWALVVKWIKDAGSAIIKLAWDLEQAKIAFTTMLWSAEKADILLKDLSNFAAKTPFELTGIRQTAKQLLAFWFSAEEIIPTLKSLWDVSSWLSVPIEQVAYAYWQVRTANQLYWTELRQFMNAWVPLLAELADMFGVTEIAVKDMVSAGKVWFKDVEIAFQRMSGEGGKFQNLMEAQSQTLQGAWSNLKDSLSSLGEIIWTIFIPVLTSLTKWIAWIVDVLKFFVWWNIKVAETLWELNNQMEKWIITWKEYVNQKKEIINKIKQNRDSLDELNEKYKFGMISITDYVKEVNRLQKEYDKLTWKAWETAIATDVLTQMIEEFYNSKTDTAQKRAELEKLRKQILANIDANIALLESEVYVSKARKTQWQGAVAQLYISEQNLIDTMQLEWDENTKLLWKLDALKNKRKEIETAQIWNIKKLDDESDAIWWVWKSIDTLKDTFKDTFTSIDKDIDRSKKKIDDYSKSIEELSWQLDDLQSDIASRVLEIDQALSATWEDTVSWDERAKLEAERAEAFIWLTEAETQALKDKIAEQDAYNKLSEIWKLKADFLKETWFTQEQAENELKIRKEQLKSEEELYKQLNDAKIALERDYTTKFKEFINQQNIAVQELQNKIYSTMWLMKSAQWTVSSISNVNNTTNKNTTIWTVVITKPTATLWDNLSP